MTEKPLNLRPGSRKHNLTKAAYNILKSDIIANKIKAGDCLSGCRLAKDLKMSRTPVREALNILASEGFVEVRNGVGILVNQTTERDILELIEVRSALECRALESRTLAVDQPGLDKLLASWEVFQNQIKAGQNPDFDEIAVVDFATHDFIIRSSRNHYLIEMTQNISARFKQMQYLSAKGLDDTANTVDQHIAILYSIKCGNLQQSVKLLKNHIEDAAAYVLDYISRSDG